MKIKALLCFFVLLCLTMNLWAGGSSQSRTTATQTRTGYQRDPNLNPPGVFPINKNKVPLKIGIAQKPVVQDWKTNWMTVQMERDGNYDLSFEVYPAGEMEQKFQLMVMAGGGDLPDVMIGDIDVATATKYGQAGMIVPLNDYYKNSAHFVNIGMAKLEMDALKYITSYDGNIYGLFRIKQDYNNEYSGARIMIYRPWLEKLGLAMPETLDDFTNVLKAFRDRDPNGNGQKDEIPLMGQKATMINNYLRAMMTPFVYTQQNFWMLNNGKIDVPFNKPEWREGLRYTKMLIDEGLLSPLSFTQDQSQLFGLIGPEPAKVGGFVDIAASFLGNNKKQVEFEILPPLKGPGGKQQVWSPTLPTMSMVITKNCKTPEAAFMLGDYMCSEPMSLAQRWGEKGVDWLVPEANAVPLYGNLGYAPTRIDIASWGVPQNKWWAETGPYIIWYKFQHGAVYVPPEVRGVYDGNLQLAQGNIKVMQFANRNPIIGLVYNEQEQEVINELYQTIITYVQESFAAFVMGNKSIDRDWDSYVAEFNRMRLNEVIKVTQSAWDRVGK